jgi:hypothetical protein
MRHTNESGIAMITTLLVLMLMSALLVGFTTIVMSDQRYRFIDRDRGQAFYAASAGVEKLTADLGNLFLEFVAPTNAQVTALTAPAKLPVISGITFAASVTPTGLPAGLLTTYHCNGGGTKTLPLVGTNGYTIRFCADAATNPVRTDDPLVISGTGTYAGMVALQTPYQIDVTAKTSTGGEVHLVRTLQSVAIPVFQFGMFSDSDLSFYARENFNFGGRVHTNGNLWLAEGTGNTLTTTGKMTALGEVVRQFLSNGVAIAAVFMNGSTLSMATSAASPAGNRNLLETEGSVTGMPGAGQTVYGNWQTVSLGATPANYNGFLRNGATGAKKLSLPLTAPGVGGTNADLIRRPLAGEDTTGILYNERLYTKASLRILLSDTAADITGLPGISAGAPISLETNWNIAANLPAGYGPIGINRPPIALSPGALTATTTNSALGTINFANAAAAAPFKPTFALCNLPPCAVPAPPITCTGKLLAQLTGCANVPATGAGATLVTLSPAGGLGGVTAVTSAATLAGALTITFANAGVIANIMPFSSWDNSANPSIMVNCTSYTATSYTGCSSNPPNAAVLMSGAMSDAGTSVVGGFIKIDKQSAGGVWTDVTAEILNYGIAGANQLGSNGSLVACGVGTNTNAIVRLQRLRDNPTAGGVCNYNADTTGAKDPTNWWPNVLFDTRESALRDPAVGTLTTMTLGGVMYYIELDAGNLAKWFTATAPLNTPGGAGLKTDNGGYTVYFSDRRNNRNALSKETAEYGWEDFVNPGTGVPNGGLDTGEDVNGNLALDTYGGVPNYNGTQNSVPPCANAPTCAAVYGAAATTGYVLTTAARPTTTLSVRTAKVNRPILFRRALKLVNGATIAPTITGLSIVSENPVYLQGNWNAFDAPSFAVGAVHAATAIIADAVTILSNSWIDNNAFAFPFQGAGTTRVRPANSNSYYRVAVLGGQGLSFTKPAPPDVPAASVFGTDGGAHNFLRMLEGGTGAANNVTVNYRGSMATLFYNRQGVGVFKCCSGTLDDGIVYGVPIRNFIFDTDFIVPALLPPNTPMFRDMNVVGFSQELRPGK